MSCLSTLKPCSQISETESLTQPQRYLISEAHTRVHSQGSKRVWLHATVSRPCGDPNHRYRPGCIRCPFQTPSGWQHEHATPATHSKSTTVDQGSASSHFSPKDSNAVACVGREADGATSRNRIKMTFLVGQGSPFRACGTVPGATLCRISTPVGGGGAGEGASYTIVRRTERNSEPVA